MKKMLLRFLVSFIVGSCLALSSPHSLAQAVADNRLEDLSAAEYAALEVITLDEVAATLSFLASDELGGRGTPSPGLDVAMAYVASRFRAVGAEGLGADGSYFLPTTIATARFPEGSGRLKTDAGEDLRTILLAATEKAIEFDGQLPRVAADHEQELSGPVIVTESLEPGASPARWLNGLCFRLRGLGASALVLEADDSSPLWAMAAARHQTAWIPSPRSNFALPILLVEKGKLPEQVVGQLDIPAVLTGESPVRNVAAIIRGTDEELADEAILFSAHVDHLGIGAPGDDPIYNGADDDASGVTAVIMLAEAYGALEPKPKRSLIFVGFWGEEMGLLGSKHFVKNSPWPLDKVIANVNIEMIGRPEAGAENKMWMTGWEKSSLGELMNLGSRRVGVETFEHPSYSARLYAASDNYSFVQQGVVAHSFSAGSLHEDYHQASDEFSKMNLPHMTQVIRGIYAGSLPLAQGEDPPSKPAE